MKIPLKELIAQSGYFLQDEDTRGSLMHLNDINVVFHSAAISGSQLRARDNTILMNRNAIPLNWYSNPKRLDCTINFGLKKACLKIEEYIGKDFNITPGRLGKLYEILQYKMPHIRTVKITKDLKDYLDELNDRREYARKEMSDTEIYDFSFDVLYELREMFSSYKGGGRLSRLIMYWIQRENRLIPIAMECDRESYENAFNVAAKEDKEEDQKKIFRLFMRKLMESHLKKFIKRAKCNDKSTSRDRILNLVKNNPKHTARTMAVKLGMSIQGVQKQIAILKAEKRLVRVGSDRNGSWKVC